MSAVAQTLAVSLRVLDFQFTMTYFNTTDPSGFPHRRPVDFELHLLPARSLNSLEINSRLCHLNFWQ